MPGVAHHSTAGAVVHSLVQHRLERALRERVRYRYVRPQVLQEGECFRVQSPNCSRNIDPAGGVIDIALLVPHAGNRWCLCARDHASASWEALLQDAELDAALDLLCADPDRRFWP
jgi:hypothetical protein